MSQLVGKYKDV